MEYEEFYDQLILREEGEAIFWLLLFSVSHFVPSPQLWW
jgi:hypothetical protein